MVKSGGKDGAEPGGHADLEEARNTLSTLLVTSYTVFSSPSAREHELYVAEVGIVPRGRLW